MLTGSRRLWRAAGPDRFVARRLNTSSIRPPRASRPGLLAPPGLGPPFNTSLLDRVVFDEDTGAVEVDQNGFAFAQAERFEFLA